MKPLAAPLAAGCMAESGSGLPQSKDFVGSLPIARLLLAEPLMSEAIVTFPRPDEWHR